MDSLAKNRPLNLPPRGLCRFGLRLAALAAGLLLPAIFADPPPAAAQADTNAVINHLNQVITWYRKVQGGSQWVLQPGDEFFWTNQRNLANQVVQHAFEWAQVEADIAANAPAAAGGAKTTVQQLRIANAASDISSRLFRYQGEIDALDQQIRAAAPGPEKEVLIARKDALQSEVKLTKDFQGVIQKLVVLTASPDAKSANLPDRIDSLRNSVPEAFGGDPPGKASPHAADGEPDGIIRQGGLLFNLIRTLHSIDALSTGKGGTADLRSQADQLALPIRAALKDIFQQGQAAANQLKTDDVGKLQSIRTNLELLQGSFKQLSAASMALRLEGMALEQSQGNLSEWRASFERRHVAIIRLLLGRAAVDVGALVVLMLISEIWRRATFRYVHDPRRRRQFLLIRRIVVGALVILILIMGFVSDFSSIATFAGFITAGIALALQTVIVSVAAYFFLVGRYGVKVGDRITISGVTGEVIDVGLVRFYLTELAGTGVDLHPTGRIVVFANSVLFQAATPLYKQIPGTDYAWHEVVVSLAPEGDHSFVEKKVLEAVNEVYAEYKPSIERQHGAIERLIDIRLDVPVPTAQIQFGESGLAVVARYPVELQRVSEVDSLIARRVMEAIRKDPKLGESVSGMPRIRAAVKA